ncbi:hypothetical protein H4Q26_008361 [Puccinia striiformis f. sp. tritici PST-130]|nr:hypothetical protein H4Q26_008361 [Puccinia striiformis f. sp. tritici PST-130]
MRSLPLTESNAAGFHAFPNLKFEMPQGKIVQRSSGFELCQVNGNADGYLSAHTELRQVTIGELPAVEHIAHACALQRYEFRISWADQRGRYVLAVCLFAGRK